MKIPYVMNQEKPDAIRDTVKCIWTTQPENKEVAAVECFISPESKALHDYYEYEGYYFPARHD